MTPAPPSTARSPPGRRNSCPPTSTSSRCPTRRVPSGQRSRSSDGAAFKGGTTGFTSQICGDGSHNRVSIAYARDDRVRAQLVAGRIGRSRANPSSHGPCPLMRSMRGSPRRSFGPVGSRRATRPNCGRSATDRPPILVAENSDLDRYDAMTARGSRPARRRWPFIHGPPPASSHERRRYRPRVVATAPLRQDLEPAAPDKGGLHLCRRARLCGSEDRAAHRASR